jgi:hypothetical protein
MEVFNLAAQAVGCENDYQLKGCEPKVRNPAAVLSMSEINKYLLSICSFYQTLRRDFLNGVRWVVPVACLH